MFTTVIKIQILRQALPTRLAEKRVTSRLTNIGFYFPFFEMILKNPQPRAR